MSTRSQIKYKDSASNIYIYKHSDGYPEGVLPVLVPFVQEFFKHRGDDEAYFLAQCVRRFAIEDAKRDAVFASQFPSDARFAKTFEFLGWGLDCEEHGDIEYLYEVDNKGNIYVNKKKLTRSQIAKYVLKVAV